MMRRQSLTRLSTLPERRAHYRDVNGYVFLDRLASEAEPSWVELTAEQAEAVQPLNPTDKRAWDKWHGPKEPA